jgi:hypothetical protein
MKILTKVDSGFNANNDCKLIFSSVIYNMKIYRLLNDGKVTENQNIVQDSVIFFRLKWEMKFTSLMWNLCLFFFYAKET